MNKVDPRDCKPGDLILNTAREDLAVFRLLGSPDQFGHVKAERLGGKRVSKVSLYPSSLPPHLRVVRPAGGAA